MLIKQNIVLDVQDSKPILLDLFYNDNAVQKPIIILSHGFKGFKDWGVFNNVAMEFLRKGFVFCKFNFSHNGTTIVDPVNFGDLDAFSENTFSRELDDLGTVIDWIFDDEMYLPLKEKDLDRLYLIGHSRGGGITILKANEDMRVRKLTTWASVNEFGRFWDRETMAKWQKDGVMIVKNSRTNQEMPMKYKMYEDYFANLDRLHIPTAVKNITQPFFIVHGENDEAVSVEMAREMHTWNPKTELKIIPNQGHTFGAKHPWEEDGLPLAFQEVVDLTAEFFEQ